MNLLEMEPGLAETMSGEAVDPIGHRDAEPTIVLDLMGEGFAIERHPTPAATIVASGVAAEVLIQRLSESAQTFGEDGGLDQAPFVSKPVTGDPAEIFGGIKVIDGDVHGAQAFIGQLISAVKRPDEEEQAATDVETERAETTPRADERTGWGRAAMLAFRRSRIGQAITVTTIGAGGVIGFGAAALSANVDSAAAAGTQSGNTSGEQTSSGATLDYVDGAVRPLAKAVIKAFHHTKPSQRHIKKHTSEMSGNGSYRNVTELSVTIPAKVAFKGGQVAQASSTLSGFGPGWDPGRPTPQHHPRQGEYTYVADFKGGIRPKNLVAVALNTQQNKNTLAPTSIYDFSLERTTKDGPLTNAEAIGMHWLMLSSYARGSSGNITPYSYASCTANGGIDLRHPTMTEPILGVAINQAVSVLRLAQQHRPIKRQQDVFASQPSAQNCP